MPARKLKVPSYCHHKASGQAVVRFHGKDFYLGRYGEQDSYQEYERLIAEWRVSQADVLRASNVPSTEVASRLTINALILAYIKFAEDYYVKDGEHTQEYTDMKYALRPLRRLYGKSLVNDFGPLALKAVRQYMIDEEKLCRNVINARVNRIRRAFKWAVSEELVPVRIYESLRTVPGLLYGRTKARESDPIKPVDQKHVDAVLPFMSRQVAALVQIQQLTAMRPSEVVTMTI